MNCRSRSISFRIVSWSTDILFSPLNVAEFSCPLSGALASAEVTPVPTRGSLARQVRPVNQNSRPAAGQARGRLSYAADMGQIRVGTASWTDRTLIAAGWYPPGANTPEKRLRVYAPQFPLVEVDSTSYPPPPEQAARS